VPFSSRGMFVLLHLPVINDNPRVLIWHLVLSGVILYSNWSCGVSCLLLLLSNRIIILLVIPIVSHTRNIITKYTGWQML